MQFADIKKLQTKTEFPALTEVSKVLEASEEKLIINTINWKDYSYKPGVLLALAYSHHEIFLRFDVFEEHFKAEMTESNQNVYEDSCVEFFVSPDSEGIYYNFEFNGLGTCLMGSGTGRENSKRVDPEIISQIRRLSSIETGPVKEKSGKFEWSLTIAIPFTVFFHHRITELNGKQFRANFYKCGDGLKVPHYVTWSPVGTENPDFHRPEFFGTLNFT